MIGQDRLRENLTVFVRAARERGEPLDHMLLPRPARPRQDLARATSSRTRWARRCASTSGPAIERPGDLAALLSNLEAGDVLFIDEIHRLPARVEEILYPAMEDFQLDILIGQGPGARSMRLDLPRFTLIGATTRAGLLTSPLRDRFGWVARLEYYPPADLERILRALGAGARCRARRGRLRRARAALARHAARRATGCCAGCATSRRSKAARGTLVDRARAHFALERLEVDASGFDRLDRSLLRTLLEKFDGGPVGLETLAAAVGEDKGTLEDVVEPFLIHEGFLARTPRGRVATRLSREYFGFPAGAASASQPQAALAPRGARGAGRPQSLAAPGRYERHTAGPGSARGAREGCAVGALTKLGRWLVIGSGAAPAGRGRHRARDRLRARATPRWPSRASS